MRFVDAVLLLWERFFALEVNTATPLGSELGGRGSDYFMVPG
jgi:hypothetical protein